MITSIYILIIIVQYSKTLPFPIDPQPRSKPKMDTPSSLPLLETSTPHRGVLYKRRDHFSSQYRPRLFVLDPPLLHYYYSPSDPSPAKSIYLTGCSITNLGEMPVEGRVMLGLQVSHKATSKTYNLAAEVGWLERRTAVAKRQQKQHTAY